MNKNNFEKIFSKKDIIEILKIKHEQSINNLFKQARELKIKTLEKDVYLRGLIEFSNICFKNCFYCGIRNENKHLKRFLMSEEEIFESINQARKMNINSIVLQSGENKSKKFIDQTATLIKKIKELNSRIDITLSCGEQNPSTYERWFKEGAKRYLLRIETSNQNIYEKIHPVDENHNFKKRLKCLSSLKKIGYQVGSGMIIGLPFQTLENIAMDILFLKDIDVDMVGLGPYIEHPNTPISLNLKKQNFNHYTDTPGKRFDLTLKTIAILRLIMKDINIVSSTALEAIEPMGRINALEVGANVIMQNLTLDKYKNHYFLYEKKIYFETLTHLEKEIINSGSFINYSSQGDPKHYLKRKEIEQGRFL